MLKRFFDISFSFVGLVLISPLFLLFMFLVFVYDFHSPFYIASRVGRGGKSFKMINEVEINLINLVLPRCE